MCSSDLIKARKLYNGTPQRLKLQPNPSVTRCRRRRASRAGDAPPQLLHSNLGMEEDPLRAGNRRSSNSGEPPPSSAGDHVSLQQQLLHLLPLLKPRAPEGIIRHPMHEHHPAWAVGNTVIRPFCITILYHNLSLCTLIFRSNT